MFHNSSCVKGHFLPRSTMAEAESGCYQVGCNASNRACCITVAQLFSSFSVLIPENGFLLLEVFGGREEAGEGSKQDWAVETLRAILHVWL